MLHINVNMLSDQYLCIRNCPKGLEGQLESSCLDPQVHGLEGQELTLDEAEVGS